MIDSGLLSLHHIGARDGSRGFPVLRAFESDMLNVLYEADPDSVAQIEAQNRELESRLRIFPFCIGGSSGAVNFNLNFDPYTSSLLPTNPDYREFYSAQEGHDYIWGEATRTIQRPQLNAITLDQLLASKLDSEPPDFLSIDTQGSEFDILSGAARSLKENVLGVLVEAEFHPLYQGQKLFGDVCDFLTRTGFHFVSFEDPFAMAPYRGPVGLRGKGFQVSTNALYLKKLESVLVSTASTEQRNQALQKLAFVAVVFGQVEYGLQCLEALSNLGGLESLTSGKRSYQLFLTELWTLFKEASIERPQTFGDLYTFESSRARFSAADLGHAERKKKSPSFGSRCKTLLHERSPSLFLLVRRIKQGLTEARAHRRRSKPGRSGKAASKAGELFSRWGLQIQLH